MSRPTRPTTPRAGRRRNERSGEAAAYLALRRRLRNQRGRQPRHPRPHRTRPSQCDIGDDAGTGNRPRRDRRAGSVPDKESALRDRIACHAVGAVPPADNAFPPARGRHVPSLPKLLRAGLLRRLDREIIYAEVKAQLAAFAQAFGRAPDFVDGHQHVQLYPQVRDAFVAAVREAAPKAWVRQGGREQPLMQRLGSPKALVLDVLSAQFRRRARQAGLAFNPAFAGAYDFTRDEADFGKLMGEFIAGLPEGARDVPSRLRRRDVAEPRSNDRCPRARA